jgi:pimeloyl-ACP methyl ester carboxylesterase
MRNVVLVHGFWHASWCWSRLTPQLAARNIPSIAVDIDGFGLNARPLSDPGSLATEPSPVAEVTASSAARSLVDQLRVIGDGEPSVVVAHSMNGVVATAAAELAPELFTHLMYVTAFAPVSGLPAAAYIATPENAGDLVQNLIAADPAAVGALRIRTDDPRLRETFYGDVDEATATAAGALITTDGPMGIAGETLTVTSSRYGAIPHSYVVCTEDNAVRPNLQRRLIREIDAVSQNPTKVFELNSAHSPFFSQPAALADAIAAVY